MQRKTQQVKPKKSVIRINTDLPARVEPRAVVMELKAPYSTKWVTVSYRPASRTYNAKGTSLWLPVPPGSQIKSSATNKKPKKAPAKVVQPNPQQQQSSVSSSRLSLKQQLTQRLAVERQHEAAKRREERNSLKYQ